MQSQDEIWMRKAYEAAICARDHGEVPVGCVIVKDGQLIGTGYNQPISTCDPTSHAEVMAIRQAASNLGNYRLLDTTLYVTLEPCAMCIGAIIHARVKRLVYAASDPKSGAVESVFSIADDSRLNHRVQYSGGVMQNECRELLRNFFVEKRKR